MATLHKQRTRQPWRACVSASLRRRLRALALPASATRSRQPLARYPAVALRAMTLVCLSVDDAHVLRVHMSIALKPLEEQVIVLTGASSGIGLCIAEAAGRAGAKLVLAARSENALQTTVDVIKERGGVAIAVVADVSKREDVDAIVRAALAQYGRIDTWINDAGVSIYGRLDEVSDADARRLFDVNYWGVVNGSLAALPHLRKDGGALINIGSEVSDAVVPLQGQYAASKHAVKGFTDTLRVEIEEVDKAPVSITLIQPTAVDTPYPQHARNYMHREPKLPEPMIDPERVAQAVLKAATHHMRDVRVGAGAALNAAVAKLAPSFADKRAAKQVSRQQSDAPPQDPRGTLDRPGESGQKRGRHPDGHGVRAPTR
jgi:short-subunit dehydrogenase